MNKEMAGIQNVHLLTDIFGYWPSFHDAEVHSVLLERHFKAGADLEMKIHVFEMTNEVNTEGYYVSKHHTIVHLRFLDVIDLEICDFNHQNVLFGLDIRNVSTANPSSSFEVDFSASYGMWASFKCCEVVVVSADVYDGFLKESLHSA